MGGINEVNGLFSCESYRTPTGITSEWTQFASWGEGLALGFIIILSLLLFTNTTIAGTHDTYTCLIWGTSGAIHLLSSQISNHWFPSLREVNRKDSEGQPEKPDMWYKTQARALGKRHQLLKRTRKVSTSLLILKHLPSCFSLCTILHMCLCSNL